ncbi:MAG: HAD family phosphatase [Nanoarchaeota archaeon]|nr:HAD family phosphatase [Nanoarchaeota archaeon]MBU4451385.1 HAD family phosphatase [Nanoarchaeota archaeon]MCG2724061.1 HAD family phosphatase [archaeon]
MKITNTLIFDMDGVIADTEPLKFEAYRQAYKELFNTCIADGEWRLGLGEEAAIREYLKRAINDVKKTVIRCFRDTENNQINELFGNCNEQILNDLNKEKIPDCMIPIVGKVKREKYAALLETALKPIKGAIDFVKYAKDNQYQIAVATGSTKAETNKILSKFGIKKYFNAIITKDDIGAGRGKPLPDLYLVCLKKLNAEPQNCLVIEDSVPGIKSAVTANIRVIAISTTVPKQKLIDAGATYAVDTFEEMKIYV